MDWVYGFDGVVWIDKKKQIDSKKINIVKQL